MKTDLYIWDRGDFESTLIDMDSSDEEVGFVTWESGGMFDTACWRGEALGAMLPERFKTQARAERAVMDSIEQEDILDG